MYFIAVLHVWKEVQNFIDELDPLCALILLKDLGVI